VLWRTFWSWTTGHYIPPWFFSDVTRLDSMITAAILRTYIRDEAWFLTVNTRHRMPKLAEPFIFPSQAIHVFYSDDIRRDGWKVVLCSEARARREVVDTLDVFITTTLETSGLTAPDVPLPLPRGQGLRLWLGQSSYQKRIISWQLPGSSSFVWICIHTLYVNMLYQVVYLTLMNCSTIETCRPS
jgi:hypothetical protein